MVVRSRLVGFNRQLEEASKDRSGPVNGRHSPQILIPFMMPGLIAGALLAFTLSLDDFVITFFTSGPETVTFPVKVYSLVRRGVSPEINAASTVLIVITVIATVVAMKLQAPEKRWALNMAEPIVSVKNVTRRYPGGVVAVDNVSVDIAQNEFLCASWALGLR